MSASSQFVKRGSVPFSVFPDSLFARHDLSPTARLVAGWMAARPDGWIFHPAAIMETHALGKKSWLSVRREFLKANLLVQAKVRVAAGRWEWKTEFFSDRLWESTMVPLAAHGDSTHRDGTCREGHHVLVVNNQQEVNNRISTEGNNPSFRKEGFKNARCLNFEHPQFSGARP